MSGKHVFKQIGARAVRRNLGRAKRTNPAKTRRLGAKRPAAKQMHAHATAARQHKRIAIKVRAHGNEGIKAHGIANAIHAKRDKDAEYASKSIEAARNIERIDSIIADGSFSEYVTKNIGKRTIDVIKLIALPQEDEKIANTLSMKINDVRRILNMLNSYGVARYDINKDNSGWLSFKWYINNSKLQEFKESISVQKNATYKLPEGCDDFFVCDKCFEKSKVVIPFDAAFESKFVCRDCGKPLRRINREEAVALLFNK